jgi:hypothetical protein
MENAGKSITLDAMNNLNSAAWLQWRRPYPAACENPLFPLLQAAFAVHTEIPSDEPNACDNLSTASTDS